MAKLGEVFTIASGGTPDKRNPSYYENGTIPWVKTGDLKNQYVPTGIDCITEEGLNNSSAKLFPPNTVLVAMYGATIGACSILSYEAATNQACAAFLPNKNVLPTYLYYFLSSKREQFVKDGVGGAQPNISAGYLKNVQFGLIPMQQQIDIVEKLDKVEKLIALRKEQLAKLDQLVKSRFVELFGDTPDEEKKTMADICKIITDGTHQPPKFTSTGIPFLFVSNIVTNEIHYDAEKFISEETYAELIKRTPIAIGDILLSTVGSYGHPAVVKSDKPFCFQRHIAYLKPNADMVNSEYLRGAILSADVQRQIDERVKGIAQKTLNLSEIRKLQLPLPSMEQQEQFAAFVEQTDKSKLAIQYSLNKLELLKKSLMQKYFG